MGASTEPNRKTWAESAGAGDRDGAFMGLSGAAGAAVASLGCVVLLTICPVFVMVVYLINRDTGGDVAAFWGAVTTDAGRAQLYQTWPVAWGGKALEAWTCFVVFGVMQAAMQLFVPGAEFRGPTSPKGNVPVYKANGVACFVLTTILFFSATWAGWIKPAHLYDIFGEILAVCNAFALLFCAFLTAKGLYFPSSSDCGTTGSIVYDYWWGTELYPRLGKHFDIKTWTNCRMGMMAWPLITICFAFKQAELYGAVSNSMLVSVILSGVYCLKFFLWETGYWKTMDIAHDRAGWYLCWGCLNWVTCIYTSQALYLVKHPTQLSSGVAAAILVTGLVMVYINWEADMQRQQFRESEGQCLIWGRKPRKVVAKYQTGAGDEKTSLLLASGWWGVARHFHYVPEILASVCWTLPSLFENALPWFYSAFLTILLVDRLYRDDTRCQAKYGKYWNEYCKIVPYRIIPFVF